MQDKVFLDTNIFIYSIDASPDQKNKRDIARQIVREQIRNDSGLVSIRSRGRTKSTFCFRRINAPKIPIST